MTELTSTPRRSGLRPATAVALAVALLAAVLLVLVTLRVAERRAVAQARANAIAGASGGVATVLSYNYKQLDADLAKSGRLLTTSFRKTYDADMTNGVRPLAVKYQAVSTADVTAAGVVSAGANRVVVLVFVQQTVTNTQLSAPRLDRSRINVTLVKQGGRWLIAQLAPI